MIFSKCKIQGAYIVDLQRHEDERGFFARIWCQKEFEEIGLRGRVAQINTGYSNKAGTLRGMHYQLPPDEEAKVVRCLRGAVFDVIVDLRPVSPTYKQWMGVDLTGENGRMLYVPEGCAHGYLTLEDATELLYLSSKRYAPEAAAGVRYNDPAIGIVWPGAARVMSQADRDWPDYRQ